ncbi:beta-1,4-xyloglucan hydrolase [Achromobacter phage Motura]|uniref:Beta-1,4-xyloglucan hydrolase n=1 Tax=Achromobacter phage Motura TaxID=2591403 RepID=A0A514CT93_9CAUD|nr:beta-1,4-xyloglucan hydrolase [Achromobacter phage Motura]QDH83707.1 beta-1,4-xyloglucan hydrolase [Achromobacter phage Motura]
MSEYSFEGFENVTTSDDFRIAGYVVGTAARTAAGNAGQSGRCAMIGVTGTNTSAAPTGGTTNTPLLIDTGTSYATLVTNRGFGMSYRVRAWIANSVLAVPRYVGDQWMVPTSGVVTGDYFGVSPNLGNWAFGSATNTQTPANGSVQATGTDGTNMLWFASGNGSNQGWYVFSGNPDIGFTRTQMPVGTQVWTAKAIEFADSKFFVVGQGPSGGFLKYSTDRTTWTDAVVATPPTQLNGITCPVGKPWVMVGNGGYIGVSNDLGTTWTRTTVGSGVYSAVVSTPTGYLTVGEGIAARSVDNGATWQAVTLPVNDFFYAMANNGETIVAVRHATTTVYVSTDLGLTWRVINTGSSATVLSNAFSKDLQFVNGRFVATYAVSNGGLWIYSSDANGENWVPELLCPLTAATVTATANHTGFFFSTITGSTASTGQAPCGVALTNGSVSTPQQNSYFYIAANAAAITSTNVPIGFNEWHQIEIKAEIASPTSVNLQYFIDGNQTAETTVSWSTITTTNNLIFSIGPSAQFVHVDDWVFFPEPTIFGDVRVLGDVPNADVGEQQWIPVPDLIENYQAVATYGATSSNTSVQSGDNGQRDTYGFGGTIPAQYSVLSVTHEASFSKLLDVAQKVKLGTVSGGVTTETSSITLTGALRSWTTVKQKLPKNPTTGAAWTREAVETAQVTILKE